MTGWNIGTAGGPVGDASVVLIEGSSFCVSEPSGDFAPDRAQGWFYNDTRLLSLWSLFVDDLRPEPVTALTPEPFHGVFLSRLLRNDGHESTLLIERRRWVGAGIREDIYVRNHSAESTACTLALSVGADLVDLFEVKGGRPIDRQVTQTCQPGGRLRFTSSRHGRTREVTVEAADFTASDARLTCGLDVAAHDVAMVTIFVRPVVDGVLMDTPFPLALDTGLSEPARRLWHWRVKTPVATADDPSVVNTLRHSAEDLGSLRIVDPSEPSRVVVAAGAPWFMALFGRDSLLTAMMAVPLDQQLALGTLQTLARLQGEHVDALTEEQPGRILHEVRLGADAELALGGSHVYYGSVDATPLFVVLLAELQRWGAVREDVDALMPHADRALDWMLTSGDPDRDGFIEYERSSDRGLINQGWKDSWDGINFADGRIAEAPIALCEVQAYAFAAYEARAHLATVASDDVVAARWTARAADLKRRFNEAFWLPDRGYFAVALDGDKRAVDACASNMGHCLWSGIVDEDKAAAVADRLMSPEMFTGWGVRTLASNMTAYNPMSYHNGSVWPHDSALIAAGLMRYGFVEQAQQLASGLFAAAERFGGRLPELFGGFARDDFAEPIPYPAACSPQAWAAAAPISLLRTLMRFDPCVPHRRLGLAPAFPVRFGKVQIDNLSVDGFRIGLDLGAASFTVRGLPAGFEVTGEPENGRSTRAGSATRGRES